MAEKRYYLYATYMVDAENSIEAIGEMIPDITKRSQGKELAIIDVKVQEAPPQAQPGYVPPEEYTEEELAEAEAQEQGEQTGEQEEAPPLVEEKAEQV